MEVYKYLGRLLAQDDDDIQAIRAQLRKARATWACVGQVLRAENVPPRVAAKFYKAVVQAVLLRQRNVGPLNDHLGKPRGVPHPRSLPDGGEA